MLRFVTVLCGLAFIASAPAVSAAATSAADAELYDYTYFLNQLVDLDGLPLLQPGVTSAQASSYDRASKIDPETGEKIAWYANGDAGQYMRVDEATKEGVMAELEGPGCIFRIWSANPQGVIRFYLDGDTTPTYEFDFDTLFSGEIEPFVRPYVWQRKAVFPDDTNPASNCYLPIPFAKSCTVTSVILDENGAPSATPGHYYHIGYKLYPEDWRVETFKLPLAPKYKAAFDEVARIWNNCGQDPQPTRRARVQNSTFKIEPGETATIFDLSGPATIRQFHARIESAAPHATRNAVLRAFWDGEDAPSILTPLGDFFGRAVGTAEYKSLPLGMTDGMDYCYWRMPFRTRGTFTVENQGAELVTVHVRFVYTTGAVPENACTFHAKWRREPQSTTFDYPFLECSGAAGIFVGDLLAIDNFVGGWWGEGDEKFNVDGEAFPSTFGTGSEDYYGDAWGIRWFVNPYHGCPQNEGRKQICYRWHISDSIPFTKSFTATIEDYSRSNKEIQNGYASVAYWYQAPGGTDFFAGELPSAEKRLPSPNVTVFGAVEAENFVADEAAVTVLSQPDVRDIYSGGKAIVAKAPAFDLAVPVNAADAYTITLYEAPDTPIPADAYTLLVDGETAESPTFLERGEHTFTVRVAAGRTEPFTLDYILTEPYRRFITDWLVVGPFDNTDDAGYDTVYPPEEKLDFSAEYDAVKGKAAWKEATAADTGFIDLDPLFDPNEWVVIYAYTNVVSPDERDTELLVGSDDGVKVWLNGALVHDNHQHRAWRVDEDRVAIHLNKGANTLLLKIDEGQVIWGFSARIVDAGLTLKYTLPKVGKE